MRSLYVSLIAALLAGGGLGLVHNAIPGDGTAGLQILLFYLGLVPLAVLSLSYPLLAYRRSVAIASATVLGWMTVKFVTTVITARYASTAQAMCLFWGFYGLLGLVANSFAVSLAVWFRRRFYPVYGPGHCSDCGYDLTGNVSGRCPECAKTVGPPG